MDGKTTWIPVTRVHLIASLVRVARFRAFCPGKDGNFSNQFTSGLQGSVALNVTLLMGGWFRKP